MTARAARIRAAALVLLGVVLVDGLVLAEVRRPAVVRVEAPRLAGVDPVLADLLVFRPGWVSRLSSSHDPQGGNNDNSGDLEAKEDGYQVLLHRHGEGRIERLWMTADSRTDVPRDYLDLWIEIDGKTVFRGPPLDLFEGRGPFRAPLVVGAGESSGAFVSYAPFAFLSEVKVRMKNRPHYYQISYRTGPGASAGASADELTRFLGERWCDQVRPAPRAAVLAEGPALVTRLGFELSPAALAASRLRVEDHGQVRLDLPLAMVVGMVPSATPTGANTVEGLGISDVSSALACARPKASLYATRMPLPLLAGERLRVVGPPGDLVPAEVVLAPPVPGVKLVAQHRITKGNGQKTTFPVFEADGPVHLISQVVSMDGGYKGERGFLEGDEMIRFDGMRMPLHLGTGTEDYFDAGFYFQNVFSNPMSGMTRFKVLEHGKADWSEATFEYSVYRHHVLDPLVGRTGMRFGWEAGQDGTYQSITYTSLVLGYAFTGAPRPQAPVRFVVGPAKDREVSLGPADETVLSALDAEAGQLPQAFPVRVRKLPTTLVVPCPDGPGPVGAQITRTFDARRRGQAAWIRLGGADTRAGFHRFDGNPFRRLAEDTAWVDLFEGDCRGGKLRLEIWPVPGGVQFSESAYEVRLFLRASM